MARPVARAQTMNGLKMETNGDPTLHVVYRGPLTGPDMRLRDGFDGWQEPIAEVKLECLPGPCLVVCYRFGTNP